jgi:predicted ATPase
MQMAYFTQLQIARWRQFSNIELDLSGQVTVLTGQNGTGKTTLLTILARHFGWNVNFVATPFWGKRKSRRFWSDVEIGREIELAPPSGSVPVGTIKYSDGRICQIHTTHHVAAQYQLSYSGQQQVTGLHIPSHRPVATYQSVESIPTDPKTIEQHYQEFQQLLFQTYGSQNVRNPGIAQKRSLMALATFGYGNEAVTPNLEYRRMFEGFQDILGTMLPEELGFERLEIRMPEVVLVTRSGTFALDSMSGGISALFGIAWQIHMYGADRNECTITIDEPENHLHPSMQRSFLPSLARAFPHFKFIIATHSPFVVTSFKDAKVYGLTLNADSRVVAKQLALDVLAGTPDRVLRDVLEVPSNLPVWVEKQVAELLTETTEHSPATQAARLLALMRQLGLWGSLPDGIVSEQPDA